MIEDISVVNTNDVVDTDFKIRELKIKIRNVGRFTIKTTYNNLFGGYKSCFVPQARLYRSNDLRELKNLEGFLTLWGFGETIEHSILSLLALVAGKKVFVGDVQYEFPQEIPLSV